jgi:methionyl-tRNA formyltransferase
VSQVSCLVAGSRPWNRDAFEWLRSEVPGRWDYIGRRGDLTQDAVAAFDPDWIFFLHWSWIVPASIHAHYRCVVFHMTDVPYGRGGSPLQNLILRGHRRTRLSALRMTDEVDAGPVYMKADLSLEGTAQEIYIRACDLSARMAARIIREAPEPVPQQGSVEKFERRTPEQSRVPPDLTPQSAYDFIRMLDADGYPRAFLEHQGMRYVFSRASLEGGTLTAHVEVTQLEKNE